MYYKCENCNHVFSDSEMGASEEKHYLDGQYAGSEWFQCCPACGGDFEEVKECENCNEYFPIDEVHDGFCVECLKKVLTFNNFLDFCLANRESRYLEEFMFYFILNCDCIPENSSPELEALLIKEYKRLAESAEWNKKMNIPDDSFMNNIVSFIEEDDEGWDVFAEFVNKKMTEENLKKKEVIE